MDHVSRGVLIRVLGSDASGISDEDVVDHVVGCGRCWRLAVAVHDQLESLGTRPNSMSESARGLLGFLRGHRTRRMERLAAEGHLVKLKGLSRAKQLEVLRTTASYRTRSMVQGLTREAALLARSGDEEVEEVGRLTLSLIELLRSDYFPERFKNDLRRDVWIEVANGRRIRADWHNAYKAASLAEDLHRSGTGNPMAAARLHSFRSALAFDTGGTVLAIKEAAVAQEIYRELEDANGLATALLQEANAMVEIEPARALSLCDEGIKLLLDRETRLHVMLRGTATQCLIELGRVGEALRQYDECKPYLEQFWNDSWLKLRFQAMEARLLDVLGRVQEAELLYRGVVEATLTEGFAKDSFIARLMLFEFYIRRNRVGDAIAVCDHASDALKEVEAHEQMRNVWRELRVYAETRQVDSDLLKALHIYLVEHWNTPAKETPLRAQSPRRKDSV